MNSPGAGVRAVAITIILSALGIQATVWADRTLLRARRAAGPFIVSIFTAPEPLRAGPVDVSVLVRSSGGAVLTEAAVDILVESTPRPIERRQARATHGAVSNRLDQRSRRGSPAAGEWTLTVSVRHHGEAASVTCPLPVASPPSRVSRIWPWLLMPLLAIALFAVHQTLKRQRPSAGLASARPRLAYRP